MKNHMRGEYGKFRHLNKDKLDLVEEIYAKRLKKTRHWTKRHIWLLISRYEKLLLTHVFTDHGYAYQLQFPGIGNVLEKHATRMVLDKQRIKRINMNAHMKTTFNEVFLKLL